MLNISIFVAYF